MIYLQTINKYWDPGVRLLDNESQRLKTDFQRYMAREYVRLIKLCIDDQRYKSKWKDLTPGYLEYKRKHGLSLNIWEATGELKNALKVTIRGRSIVIGFDKRSGHKGSKAKLYMIAKWMEYGTIKMPPRPLFRVVYMYMSANVNYFLKKFLREEGY